VAVPPGHAIGSAGSKRDARRAAYFLACPVTLSHVSTKDQALSAELHGEALLTARRPELQPLIEHLREVAQGRDDIRTECAGTLAGGWFASGVRRGEELIAAGLLMLAGPIDLDELEQWMRVGWERRRGTDVPYGPTS
jgi:hypothetical protein